MPSAAGRGVFFGALRARGFDINVAPARWLNERYSRPRLTEVDDAALARAGCDRHSPDGSGNVGWRKPIAHAATRLGRIGAGSIIEVVTARHAAVEILRGRPFNSNRLPSVGMLICGIRNLVSRIRPGYRRDT